MGNASGRGRENGSCGSSAIGGGDRSFDLMSSSPPESPDRSQSPPLSAPQVPVAPLQEAVDDVPPVYDHLMTDAHGPSDTPLEKGIPTLITWSYEGNDIAVEGSWDNWTSRKVLQGTGKEHSILLVLPSGLYHYKFIADGEWRYIPDLPYVTDVMGQISNVLDLNDYVPENLDGVSEFECPPSPDSSYGQPFPEEDDFAAEPPAIPPQLRRKVLGNHNSEEVFERPSHTTLDHLFTDKGWASQSVVAVGLTHRYRFKYINVVLYKPLRR